MRKHKKVSVANVSLATWKQVKATEVFYEPNSASCEANQALRKPKLALVEAITVLTGAKLAPR